MSQTAYQHSLSCSDAIFSTQEALLKFVREGDKAYLCLYMTWKRPLTALNLRHFYHTCSSVELMGDAGD